MMTMLVCDRLGDSTENFKFSSYLYMYVSFSVTATTVMLLFTKVPVWRHPDLAFISFVPLYFDKPPCVDLFKFWFPGCELDGGLTSSTSRDF